MAPHGRITDFFRPFAGRLPVQQTTEEEIIVASSRSISLEASETPTDPTKRGRGRPKKKAETISPPGNTLQKQPVEPQSNHSGTTPATKQRVEEGESLTSSLTPLETTQSSPTSVCSLRAVQISPPEPKVVETSADRPPTEESCRSPPQNVGSAAASSSVLSSFQSAGLSSQSSSKRTIKDGLKAVTNSDSDSLSASSDDGLADIADFIPSKRRKVTTSGAGASRAIEIKDEQIEPRRRSSRRSGDDIKRSVRKSLPSPPPQPTHKHSLAELLRDHRKREANEARIQEAEGDVEEEQRRAEETEAVEMQKRTGDGMALAKRLIGDGEGGERMRAAMERTEAMEDNEVFHFFRGDDFDHRRPEFPMDALEGGLQFLEDEAHRDDAFLSGFVADVAEHTGLPDDIMLWIYSALLCGPSEQLQVAYVGVIEAATRGEIPFSLRKRCLLRETYPGRTCLDDHDQTSILEGSRPTPPPNLTYVLQAMTILAHGMNSIEQRASALVELVLLNVDEGVRDSIGLQSAVEEALQGLLDFEEAPEKLEAILQSTTGQLLEQELLSKRLFCHAILSLPASTANLHLFRRLLALHYVLSADTDELIDPTSPDTGTRLLVKLKRDALFAISDDTDYHFLLSLIPVLEIAIDAGFSDFSFMASRAARPSKSTGLWRRDPAESAAEAAFNTQVDDLATRLRLMASNIRDTGTSHLKRTETKSDLDRLCVRLEYSVRSKRKPRKGVFGGDAGGVESDFMKSFLSRAEDDGGVAMDAGTEGRSEDRVLREQPSDSSPSQGWKGKGQTR